MPTRRSPFCASPKRFLSPKSRSFEDTCSQWFMIPTSPARASRHSSRCLEPHDCPREPRLGCTPHPAPPTQRPSGPPGHTVIPPEPPAAWRSVRGGPSSAADRALPSFPATQPAVRPRCFASVTGGAGSWRQGLQPDERSVSVGPWPSAPGEWPPQGLLPAPTPRLGSRPPRQGTRPCLP